MHRVPVRIAIRKCSPLTTGRRHVENGVDHTAAIHLDRAAYRPRCPIGCDQVSDEFPLFIAHITVRRSPGLGRCNRMGFHEQTLRDRRTLKMAIYSLICLLFPNIL